MVGAPALPGLTLRARGKEGWEAAGCAGGGLGGSWDFGAGSMAGAPIAWMRGLQWCLCSRQREGKHGAKPLLRYIQVTAVDCSN